MTKLIQLMHPGKSGLKDFSLAAVPEHDQGKTPAPNIFYITGCPHRVTPEALAEAPANGPRLLLRCRGR